MPIAIKYMKRYPALSTIVICSIMAASIFEGASFGMLIPLIQSMVSTSGNLVGKMPFITPLTAPLLSMNQTQVISLIFIFLFLILLLKNVFIYLSQVLIAKLRFCATRDFRISLMNNLLEYDIKYFENQKIGHIISVFNTETVRMGDFIMAVLQLTVLLGRVSVYIALLFFISWKASFAVFLLMSLILIPIEFILKKVKNLGIRFSQVLASYNFKLTEILNGIRLIRECSEENVEKQNFKNETDNTYHVMYTRSKYLQLIVPLSEVFIFGLIILCFLALINFMKIDTAKSFPFIATYLLVLGRTLTQLNALNNMRASAVYNLAAFTGYEEIHDEKGKKTIKDGKTVIKKFSDSILFKNVNFSYVPGKPVLKNINLRVPKGKIVALVGASGAGKSTIVKLISRFYDRDSGEILVDGIDLKELMLKEWRKKIGFVSQDIFIFNTSVKNNIAYGRAYLGEDAIIKAAKAANSHDFIMNLPNGYDTVLGERGVKLSGGQKQRISIARAIIHNPDTLILDEATSSLDTETEKLITEAVDKLTKDRTVIAIAHRLSTVLHADNIIVLDDGSIIEEGNHRDLIRKNGSYKRLYDAQFNL